MPVFDLFSKRNQPPPELQRDHLPVKVRNQFMIAWKAMPTDPRYENIFDLVNQVLCREHGIMRLASVANTFLEFSGEQALKEEFFYFFQCADNTPLLIDSVELFFRIALANARYAGTPGTIAAEVREIGKLIDEFNCRFRENGVGYEISTESGYITAVTSQVLHREVVSPALQLLTHPDFATANEEYQTAHGNFRNRNYVDCLTYCGKAFESTLKIICDKKGWQYNQTDAASPLLRSYMQNSGLPTYFETLLMIIATLRNKMGAHGQGTQPVQVPEHFAKYALHATGAAILLLVDHAR